MGENSAAIGLEWREKFEQNRSPDHQKANLKEAIEPYLKNCAIKSYTITQSPVLTIALEDDMVQRTVIDAIEWFLFAEDPVVGKKKLSELSNPPTLCGKVFKNSEPTYSCRDCAHDATCVLCMTCFGRSIHKNHNYRLNTSSGGGCCDCGDEEAWKQGASCEIHSAKSDVSTNEDLLTKLPADLHQRARCLLTILLDFCVQVICDPNDEELLTELPTKPNNEHTHATLLYNDESHTFQGVILALQKSVPHCTSKLGNDFATVVDREGRSSVFTGSLSVCNQVTASIQQHTSGHSGPLRCETAHIYTVACQLMALKLMKWLSSITEDSDCLRRLHSTLCTTSNYGRPSHLTRVLRADGKLWKVARHHNHQVFMNTLLKDSFGKVTLAIEFTKNYSTIIDDYYKDDQEHSISAAGMSVQLFTVPSLVQLLTVNYGLMEIVMGVLLEKTGTYVKDDGVIDFSQDERDKSFRLLWVIHDLRYIVQNKPNEWNEQLKERFYKFLELFLRMFRRFQGLGLVKRARGIHVEIEPDWNRDYKFQLRLINLVPFILRWCEADRDVLLKSIALTLDCLKDIKKSTGPTKLKKYHDGKKSTMKVFDFDVSSEKVSMHIPIVRFLAGLIGRCQKYSLSIRDVLEIKKDEDALVYLEYPLKVLVFSAQVHSGMWKRNGYSVLHQVIANRKDNPAEIYDKDVFLMQVLASYMDKDYFLHVVLDMFQLHSWAASNYNIDKMDETALNQQLALAGEFLRLLIIILGERYNSVIGQVDSQREMKREVIHRLCLGDMSRSELMRKLTPLESQFEHGGEIDGIIASVATFKKPGLSSKGIYKIKKEFISDFNPFFYHYDKNEQSKAENNLTKKCKEEEIPPVFTPPVPVEFLPAYSSIVYLLSSKTMIGLLTVLLWRIKHANPRSWTDTILHEVLHLIGLALHEETRQRKMGKSFGFVSAATKRSSHGLKHYSLFKCLEALQGEPIIQAYNGLLAWIIQKVTEEQSIRNGTGEPTVESSTPMDVSETQDQEKLQRQQQAKERRERILQQMSNMQKAFIRQNSDLYLSTNTDLTDSEQDETDSIIASHSEQPVIAIGNTRGPSIIVPREQFICILCQENPTSSERPLVYSAYVQRSTLLSSSNDQTLEKGDKADPLVLHRDQRVGTHVGSCGHIMHGDCWQRFFESILANDRLSLRARARITSFDLAKREFLCPLCSGLGNTVLPIMCPGVTAEHENSKLKYISWVATFHKIDSKITKDLIEFSQSEESEESFLKTLKEKFLPLIYGTKLSNDMQSMMKVFTRAAYTFGLNVLPDDEDCRVPLMVWSTCAYTLQCFEHSSREESSGIVSRCSKRDVDILRSLVFVANSMSSIGKSRDIVKNGLRLISLVTANDKLVPEKRSMMELDLFDWMVKMRFSLPSIDCPDNSSQPAEGDGLSSVELDGFVFHLALAANIVQLLLTTSEDIPSDEMDEDSEQDAGIAKEMANLWKTLRHLSNPDAKTSDHPNPQRLLAHVRYRLLPFLRCCAIYFFILNSTSVPLALREKFVSFDKEFDSLAEYLALPRNLMDLLSWSDSENTFSDELVAKIVRRWCTNVNIVDSSPNLSSSILMQKSLVKLPHDYSELISQASQYECPLFSGEDNRVPAKCLVCGQWLCSEGWCCKQTIENQNVGSCTAHAVTCGAGAGIFIRVRDCIILLLNGVGKGCFYPSPYLDAYGETDPGLRRGNPLYLCEERYQRLQKLWKQHGIASEIVRNLETNRHLMQVDWTNY